MIGRDLPRSDRLLIRFLQIHRLLPVETILEMVEAQKRLREEGVRKNLAMVIKDHDLLPRRRLKALAKAVKFNIQRTRDKRWAQTVLDRGVVAAGAIDRCLARQLSLWEESFTLRPLADLLVSDENVPVASLAEHLAEASPSAARSTTAAASPIPPEEDSESLMVLELEDSSEFSEPLSDSDVVPPDEDDE